MSDEQSESKFPEGIDPELIPYFLAAEEEDEEESGEEEFAKSVEEEDEEALDALRDLVRNTLLAGADPELVEAILSGEEGEDDEDEEREQLVDEAVAQAQAEAFAAEVYRSLLARTPEHDFDPSLERVRQTLDILGDPQTSYPSIHVAGTNGKTSTTRMAAALLTAFGVRTGSFTSPHLHNVRERIAVNGEALSAEDFVAAWLDVAPYIEMTDAASLAEGGPQISYFEALTIMAMAWFADVPVDASVFETGLGGRLDATNLLDAGVCVLTPISLDHQRYLGDSITEITFEKAQIIKDKSIAVVAHQKEEALEVIERRCLETDSIYRLEGRDWEVLGRVPGVGGQIIDVRTPAGVYEQIFVPLHGEHQAHNAAAALVAVEAMMGGKVLPSEIVEEGFLSVRSPGRLEVVRTSPVVVVDGAHNPASVVALRESLEESFRFNYTVGLFSAMGDKAIEEMLVEIEPDLNEIVLAPMSGDRAASMEDLQEIAVDVFGEDRVYVADDIADGIDIATRLVDAPQDATLTRGIIAFGSIQLAGQVAGLLQK